MNKHFAGVKALDIVLNPINVVCLWELKSHTVTPSGTQTQMTNLRYFSPDVTVFGGGLFCQTFRHKLKI